MSVKEQVLAALREAEGLYLSGEAISSRLGVSRTAVFKQIEALRALGYQIDAMPRRGYRLASEPDLVTADQIAQAGIAGRFGGRIVYLPSVGSTNEAAKEAARQGAREGTLVIADQQTSGKGRLGRPWASPSGAGIWMSLVLRPQAPPYQAPRLTLVAAVAVGEAVRAVTGLDAGIKWPNDLQVGGRKFCGILTEMEAELDRVAFVICGIGINVNAVPDQFRPGATSLKEEAGRTLRRAPLVAAVLASFERWYDRPFAEALSRWRELSITLGRKVSVVPAAGGSPVEGIARDVDEEGALLVEVDGKVRRVVAGEVSIR